LDQVFDLDQVIVSVTQADIATLSWAEKPRRDQSHCQRTNDEKA
jgi:hypothetical protein